MENMQITGKDLVFVCVGAIMVLVNVWGVILALRTTCLGGLVKTAMGLGVGVMVIGGTLLLKVEVGWLFLVLPAISLAGSWDWIVQMTNQLKVRKEE